MKWLSLQLGGLETFILMTIVFLIAMLILMTMSKQNTRPRILKPEIRTELICENCHTKVVREFREGEYISMEVDEKCPRCKGPLVINLIFSEIPQRK